MFQVSNNLIPLMRRTALSFTASAAIFAPIAHQGKWHQSPLNARESRATPNLDRRYSVVPLRDSHAATSGPVPALVAAWSRVAQCEEGSRWGTFTYWYPDALGITRPNWVSAGGSLRRPSPRLVQIRIAESLVRRWHILIPDQNGVCRAW